MTMPPRLRRPAPRPAGAFFSEAKLARAGGLSPRNIEHRLGARGRCFAFSDKIGPRSEQIFTIPVLQ